MKTLLWAEKVKLRHSKILRIAFFSVIMVTIIVYLQGQFTFNGHRYVDDAGWYMTATQSLGSLFVLPAIITLMGSYMISREEQDDTLKSLVLVPVSISELLKAKLIITAIFAVALYALLFILTLMVEVFLHASLIDLGMVLNFARIYLVEGICMFFAVSPIIAFVYKLKKGYWIALIFAELYSFLGLFAGMQGTMCSIYPITAAFCISGYYETTTLQFVISFISLLICLALALMILIKLDKKDSKIG